MWNWLFNMFSNFLLPLYQVTNAICPFWMPQMNGAAGCIWTAISPPPPHRAPLCQGIGGVPVVIIILRITWSSYASYACSLLWCSWSYCVRVSSAHCLQNNDKNFIVFYQKRLHVFPLQKYLVNQAGQMFLHQWCNFFMIFCQTNLLDQPPHIAPENIKGKLW